MVRHVTFGYLISMMSSCCIFLTSFHIVFASKLGRVVSSFVVHCSHTGDHNQNCQQQLHSSYNVDLHRQKMSWRCNALPRLVILGTMYFCLLCVFICNCRKRCDKFTSSVTSRHRGQKRKLRAGYRAPSLQCTLSYVANVNFSSSSVVSRDFSALCVYLQVFEVQTL